ncbi:O-antigen ligase family protein [Fluviicola chungangensis]|uniref:O-antigen ligase family protein n=1 Tax=Fluviicola chungangensis TaxID=2597671 RepID=A0A556N0T5_9FLAO|nr:O-antigen ligase family protein [Fluviicola chungangensis]TSJ45800.1 hypothetical protein FO442_08615 [Fluviicola chungangensis]
MREQTAIETKLRITRKDIFWFLLLWIILFIEPISIGPIKISQIWKGIVVILLLFSLIKYKLPSFVWVGFLFAFKFLIFSEMPYGYLRAIQDFLEAIIFPLTLAYLFTKYRNSNKRNELMRIPIWLSLFIIYSSVPFLFGLKGLNPETDLERYGLEANAMKGLFYHIATSSKLYTIATIILFNTYKFFSHKISYQIIWLTAVLLGTYFVYTSWTRTGWLIFSIALLISLFYGANLKRKILGITLSAIILIGLGWLYEYNQAFRWRLSGGAVYRDNTELSFDELAKARLPFIYIAIDNLREEGVGAQLIGYGTQKGIDLFDQKTGMAIVSHNRTFEILESSGLIGLILYFLFLNSLNKKIQASRRTKKIPFIFNKMLLVSFVMFLGFYVTSHGTPLWGEIIFASLAMVVILNINDKQHLYEAENPVY